MEEILRDNRTYQYQKARQILLDEGLQLSSNVNSGRSLGFLGDNLTHGAIEKPARVLATGVCFPERPTLQSVLPLLAIKDLLDNDQADIAYVAMPLFAYAGAGLARQAQYLEILGLMGKLFQDDLGERVVIIPDSREEVMAMKYKVSNIASRHVNDGPAREKYPFKNLFAYFETASYGADIMLAALSEQADTTIVADFRQFESIHAGIKMNKGMAHKVGALLYTLINPKIIDGKLREVSQDSEEGFDLGEGPRLPETSDLFYQAALLLSPEEVTQLYIDFRRGIVTVDVRKRVSSAKSAFFNITPASSRFAEDLENKSLTRMKASEDFLGAELEKRVSVDERDRRKGVIYEYQ